MKKQGGGQISNGQLFDLLFNKSTEGVIVASIDGKKFLYANKAICDILGYSKKAMLKKCVKNIHAKKYLKQATKDFKGLVRGKIKSLKEEEFITKDKKKVYLDISVSMMEFDGQKVIIGFFRDRTKEKEINQKLKESEKRYQGLFDKMRSGVAIYETKDKGKTFLFKDFNKAGQRIDNIKLKDVIGNDVAKVFPGVKKFSLFSTFQRVYKTGKTEHHPISLYKDKRIIGWRDNDVYKLPGEEIMAVYQDVTKAKEAERKLIESEEKFRTIFESTFDAIWIADRSITIRDVNQEALKMLGYSREELIGKKIKEIDIESKVNVLKKAKEVFAKGRAEFESQHQKKDGSIIDVLVSVRATKIKSKPIFIVLIKDITAKKKAEDEIRKLAAIPKYSSELINMSDLEGNMIFINDAGSKMLGISPDEVTKHKILEVIAKSSMPKVKKDLLPALTKGKTWEGELSYKNLKTGQLTHVYAMTFTIKDEKTKKPIYLANVSRDIGREKEIEKLKSDFVFVASHQLRTPLSSVKWFIELLRKEKNQEKRKRFLQRIYDANQHLIELVSNLLDVSRIETGKKFKIRKKKANLISIIERVIKDEKVLVNHRGVEVVFAAPKNKKLILPVDTKKIEQVFQNLVHNAVKFSKPHGVVDIKIKVNSNSVTISISDYGVGIPQHQQTKIFEKFFRADNVAYSREGGTGLGLFIAKKIVEGHSGKIWFKSKKNKGTTFYVSLPKI